ncbi:uncharacterized mitochondrial protein AtMg00810-like [Hibiscus syriacus]|uniref:uncharacterized mitochondrial protein AtMg00810-like n=1 Tax=Hibiscus syriacus TaxID=106335 RepID=UPI001923B93D|nr:uncharacterized mitochondrial protein AtMg00810-like [Hibiscus syriacus]
MMKVVVWMEWKYGEGSGDAFVALLVYVDGIVIAGAYLQLLHRIQSLLQKHFKLKELGTLRYFLGFELLRDAGCLGVKLVESPMVHSLKLSADEREPLPNPQEYCRLIGRLLYLTNSRPDIVHTVHLLSQFVYSPRLPPMTALKHLLAYIKQSSGLGLLFPVHYSVQLSIFVDSDYGSCPDTRHCTSGFCIFL